jgi:hypothetical protein
MKSPTVVDLMPGTPYNQQVANCCRGGVISAYGQDPATSVAAFQVTVGNAGTSAQTVLLPKNFTLNTPGPGYTCSDAKVVKPSQFISEDGRRHTQVLMTWELTCKYSQFIAQRAPTCCVALSSFYNDTIVPCPICSCACQDKITQAGTCIEYANSTKLLQSAFSFEFYVQEREVIDYFVVLQGRFPISQDTGYKHTPEQHTSYTVHTSHVPN